MNVLFAYSLDDIQSPSKPLQTQQQIQFGISYISSFLKKHGHNTRLIVTSKILGRKNRYVIDRHLKVFKPKLICFTAVATEYPFIANLAKYLKTNYPDIYLLIGGPHASLNPDEVLPGDFDAICIGEGEYPTLELICQLERGKSPSGIPNLWIKNGAEIEKNSTRPFLQDLDSLPFPDREIWHDWTEEKSVSKSSVLLSRGCPFQCTYCCNHALRKLADGSYVRQRSVDNVVEEIRKLVDSYPTLKEIYLEIETICINRDWAIELCRKLERLNATLNQPLSFGVNVRITPDADLEELFAAFRNSNFRFVNIGLESGSERVRREILRRDYSNQDIVKTVSLARKYDLKVCFYNMIGIPGETIDDFRETVKINRACLPDWNLTSIFFPYPGTDLYSLCRERGLLKGRLDERMERRKALLDFEEFPRKDIQKSYIWFDYYVYDGLKPKYKIFARLLRSRIESEYYLNYLYRRLTSFGFFKGLKKILKES